MPASHTADLINREDIWHASLEAKLSGLLESNQFENFKRCGRTQLFKTCVKCGDWSALTYRCSIKWCPRCNWRIARQRAELVRAWSKTISQPKHMVLTQRNFPVLTRKKLRAHVKALAKLRRNKVFAEVRGGCVSVEITNEGKGWHLHSHWYVDARFIDTGKLAQAWGALVGQEYGIVKVKDCRQGDYAHEVAKYVVKGSDLAKWPSEEAMEFVTAVKGVRFFFTFGVLTKERRRIKAEVESQKPEAKPCECGCCKFRFESEESAILNQVRRETWRDDRRKAGHKTTPAPKPFRPVTAHRNLL